MKNKTKKLNSGKKNIKKAGSTRNKRKPILEPILETIRSFNPLSRRNSNIQFSRVVPIETTHNAQNSAVSTLKVSIPQEMPHLQQPTQSSKLSKTLHPNRRLLRYIEKKNEDAAIKLIREKQYTGNVYHLFHRAVKQKMGETILWFIIKENEELKNKTKIKELKNLIITFLDNYSTQYNKYRIDEKTQLEDFIKKTEDINKNKRFIYDTIKGFDIYDNVKNELINEYNTNDDKKTSIEKVLIDTREYVLNSNFFEKSLHITELNDTISSFKKKLQKVIAENAKEENDYQIK